MRASGGSIDGDSDLTWRCHDSQKKFKNPVSNESKPNPDLVICGRCGLVWVPLKVGAAELGVLCRYQVAGANQTKLSVVIRRYCFPW
jgi:hypothetical protein